MRQNQVEAKDETAPDPEDPDIFTSIIRSADTKVSLELNGLLACDHQSVACNVASVQLHVLPLPDQLIKLFLTPLPWPLSSKRVRMVEQTCL